MLSTNLTHSDNFDKSFWKKQRIKSEKIASYDLQQSFFFSIFAPHFKN